MKKIFFKITYLFSCIALVACSHSTTPTGKALVAGTVTDSSLAEYKTDSIVISFGVPDGLIQKAQRIEYEAKVQADGTFSINIPLLHPTTAVISVNYQEPCGMILVMPGEEAKLGITLNEQGEAQMQMIKGKGWTQQETDKLWEVNMEVRAALQDCRNCPSLSCDTPPEIYRDSIKVKIEKDLSIVKNSPKIPEELKQLLYNMLRLCYLNYLALLNKYIFVSLQKN